jgi:transposase
MSQKSGTPKLSSERIVKHIRRASRKQYSAEEKIRIVLDGLRGEHSIAALCRREGIAENFTWSKQFPEAGKRRLAGDTARAARSTVCALVSARVGAWMSRGASWSANLLMCYAFAFELLYRKVFARGGWVSALRYRLLPQGAITTIVPSRPAQRDHPGNAK